MVDQQPSSPGASRRRGPLLPTAEQHAILAAQHRRLIVEANAGAGKTTTVALRVREQLARGTPPQRVLVLTYTQPGCIAVRQALLRVGAGESTGAGAGTITGTSSAVIRQLRIETFDDFCAARLRAVEGPVPLLADPERQRPHVLAAVARARAATADRHAADFQLVGDGALAVEELLNRFRHLKGTMAWQRAGDGFRLTPASAIDLGHDFTVLAVYRAFEASRRGGLARDIEWPVFRQPHDATFDLASMLAAIEPPFDESAHPLALDLDLVVVDELHDLNRAMLTVLQGLLAHNPDADFVGVGDRDQVIHTEAGAEAELMGAGFDVELGRAERLPLTASRRFAEPLADLLGHHARKPYASLCAWPSRVEVVATKDGIEVCRVIERLLAPAGDARGMPRTPPGDLAVLLRHPGRSVELENRLLDRGIDYRTVGFKSYLLRPEILFARGILALALGLFDRVIEHAQARRELVQAMLLFTGSSLLTTVDGIDAERVTQENRWIRALADGPAFPAYFHEVMLTRVEPRAATAMRRATEIASGNRIEEVGAVLAALDLPWFASRVLVHAEAINAVAESVAGLAADALQFESIERFLHGINERELRVRSMPAANTIRLSTIEAAKGLEFDQVIVPGVDAGDFDATSADERNLFYVAASRARRGLTLLHAPGRPGACLRAIEAVQEPGAVPPA